MKKRKYNFKEIKEMLKEDSDEGILFLIFLFLEIYLILNSKMVLAVVTIIIFTLTLIIYRKHFKKRKKITIEHKKYYEFLGKFIFVIILLGFIIRYTIELIKAIGWFLKGPTWFTYFNITIATLVVILSGISCYIVAKGKFNQNIFFAIFGLVLVYETFVLSIIKHVGLYISAIFLLSIYLFIIWSGIKNPKNETKPKILSKK